MLSCSSSKRIVEKQEYVETGDHLTKRLGENHLLSTQNPLWGVKASNKPTSLLRSASLDVLGPWHFAQLETRHETKAFSPRCSELFFFVGQKGDENDELNGFNFGHFIVCFFCTVACRMIHPIFFRHPKHIEWASALVPPTPFLWLDPEGSSREGSRVLKGAGGSLGTPRKDCAATGAGGGLGTQRKDCAATGAGGGLGTQRKV